MDFDLTSEQQQLRDAVASLGRRYGHGYFVAKAKSGGHTTELWDEAGRLGYLGVNIPAEYGGGGGGITELSIVCEELAAAGCPLLLLVVSPAIAATVIGRHGTQAQRRRFLPGFADGSLKMVFAITEPEAGSNFHRLGTVARRDGDGWTLSGRKCFISGVDEAPYVLVVARVADDEPEAADRSDGSAASPGLTGRGGAAGSTARGGAAGDRLKPALFIVPTDAPGLTRSKLEMEIVSPENQWLLYLDDVRLPADALLGSDSGADYRSGLAAGLPALFAGLNPERITVAAMAAGTARYAIERASTYTASRQVWGRPIGAHQGVSHPLAHAAVQLELARLMIAKAATLYDAGRDAEAGVAANLAKYASAEASALAVDTAIQVHGGNGMTTEYGVATLLGAVRAGRIAPVSREMILNFVAQHVLRQPKAY
ncbi:acyl-CoA dehydrogenase family protein [Plantactinospora soyae]|uniref:Alkylation response protein AidB-like acyl-CoA dehydrogenase n=1 Tax=Plantactinospora soyae TaxID=1544732 RepID=A0A927M8M0_9ACTN|nr:acyl-CoA dehydrogenase family protein [Plantactinospora soyae]MBE1486475.1 alkylation response protein AidB-like acyl-CoA dehydrogenase [Plantactinospora soyae]